MPTWLSTCRIFFWWAASSDWALCRNRTTINTQGSPPLMDEFSSYCCFNPVEHFWTANDFTFNATRTAWVLDLSPTVAEPCFTASMAYSIWWMRPWNRNKNRMDYVWTFTTVSREPAKDRLQYTATYLWAPYCHVVVVLIAKLWIKTKTEFKSHFYINITNKIIHVSYVIVLHHLWFSSVTFFLLGS